ncbi:flagellin N-terminal helical domain-containing protein [Rhodanobacter koreensis]
MSLVINTNINSLNTQNNLSKSQSALSKATQRLSSGLKINSAADNAAGFAISQRYTTQIGGLAQASANASDAINLAQTAGSALDQVTANLQAIRDLAAQSANGTYSADDRATIDSEVQQRLQEVTRIANQTTFNGKKVLDGSLQSQSFQIGANVGQTVSVSLGTSVKASDMGAIATSSTGDISGDFKSTTPAGLTLAAGDLKIGGTDITGTFTDAASLATAINAQTGTTNVTASVVSGELHLSNAGAATTVTGTKAAALFGSASTALADGTVTPTTADSTGVAAAVAAPASTSSGLTLGAGDLNINGTDIKGTFNSVQDLSDAINAANVTGVSAAVNAAGNGLNLYSNVALTVYGAAADSASTATNALKFSGAGADNTTAAIATSGDLATGNVKTVDGANDLISRIDVALSSVANFAANLGAVQNRFQSTISTLSAQTTNLQASQSTIQDADFAAETANLSKAQVLQQAGISVLAQANSNPQQVLKLLQ